MSHAYKSGKPDFINWYDRIAYPQVPRPPEVPPSALSATSANLTWNCPLEKNYSIRSYTINITINNASSVDADCLNGRNQSYYITVPGSQRYVVLSLGK